MQVLKDLKEELPYSAFLECTFYHPFYYHDFFLSSHPMKWWNKKLGDKLTLENISLPVVVTLYIGYKGTCMCGTKGYGFWAILVRNNVWILNISIWNSVCLAVCPVIWFDQLHRWNCVFFPHIKIRKFEALLNCLHKWRPFLVSEDHVCTM